MQVERYSSEGADPIRQWAYDRIEERERREENTVCVILALVCIAASGWLLLWVSAH